MSAGGRWAALEQKQQRILSRLGEKPKRLRSKDAVVERDGGDVAVPRAPKQCSVSGSAGCPITRRFSSARKPRGAHYDISAWDPRTIRENSTVLVAGGRRTGKSYAARCIIHYLKDRVYDCYVYSGTKEDEYPWERFTPAKYVTYVEEKFPDSHLDAVLDRQYARKEVASGCHTGALPTLLVFEDLEYLTKSMWKNQSIRKVMFNGRHARTFAIAAVQYIMEIDMAVRSMFDYAVFTMCPVMAVRERIWKQYAGIFRTFAEFEAVFATCTADHGCMVVDCRANSPRVEDTIYRFKAEDHGFFCVGVPDVWDERVDERNAEDAVRRAAVTRTISAPPRKTPGQDGDITVSFV